MVVCQYEFVPLSPLFSPDLPFPMRRVGWQRDGDV